MGKGIENMLRLAGLAILRSAKCLAVDGDDAAPAPLGNPSREGFRKGPVVEGAKHRSEGLGRGDAILERQKTPEPLQLLLREIDDLVPILHPAQRPHQRDQQYLLKRIGHHPNNARVRYDAYPGNKVLRLFHKKTSHTVEAFLESRRC